MKKFWHAILILTALTALSFLVDANVNALMTSLRNPYFDSIMFFFTALGGLTIGLPFIIITVLLLEMKHKGKAAANLVAALAIDIIITTFIKLVIQRDRPSTMYDPTDATEAYMSSFPSGHSSRAFVMFNTLNNYYNKPVLFYSIAALVAFSRIYFGVHYLSDVLAGIIIGLIVSHEVCKKDFGTRLIRRFKNKQ